MGIRKIVVIAALLGLELLACGAHAASSVWKVSKGDDYFYLGGTIHVLTLADYPLPKEFTRAYQDAGRIVLETDLAAAQTPEFQAKFLAALTYDDERTLASELAPGNYRKLQAFMASRQLSVERFEKFRPWGVSLMITVLEYQRFGMLPNYGVDYYFSQRALADRKQFIYLETPDEQLRFLQSMAGVDPDAEIEYTLRDLDRLPDFIQVMKQNWRSGDLEAFTTNAFVTEMKTDFPELYAELVTRRNNAWMRQLPALFDDSETELVLVGAMHLSGREGLLDQLRRRGYRVEQL